MNQLSLFFIPMSNSWDHIIIGNKFKSYSSNSFFIFLMPYIINNSLFSEDTYGYYKIIDNREVYIKIWIRFKED